MKGENDEGLPWLFTGKVTVKFHNQLEDKKHHSVSIKFTSDDDFSRLLDKESLSGGWGWTTYISRSDLGHNTAKNCQYKII